MAERNPSRPWTDQEDALLKEGVAQYGEQDRWKDIAEGVPGRTNKACRKRWLHSLSPTLKKTAWTQSEDAHLLILYERHGPKWSVIAREIPGRTDDACSKRYREALDPSLKKEPWNPEEDQKLVEAFARHGTLWTAIGQELGRSGLSCRNRWRLLERKRAAGRSQPYASPMLHGIPPPLEPSTSQGSNSTQQSEPSSPAPAISLLEPQEAPLYRLEDYPIAVHSKSSIAFEDPVPGVVSHKGPTTLCSTSSLSAALSAPPAQPRPLPEDSFVHYHHPGSHHYSHSQPTSQTTSPLFYGSTQMPSNDVAMSLGDYGMDTFNHQQHDSSAFNMVEFTQSFAGPSPTTLPALSFAHNVFQENVYGNVSPISPSVMPLPAETLYFGEPEWKSPHFSSLFAGTFPDYTPSPLQTSMSSVTTEPLDLSSTNSSPYDVSASISPASPSYDMPPDLPLALADISSIGVSPTAGGSLLFSVPQAPTRRKRTPRTRPESAAATRLSSTLKLSDDPEVRPYACGHDECWNSEKLTSLASFQTSKDLCDHHRECHGELEGYDKLFRCGLDKCDKSWKSVNGLQYHLQISTVHFKRAVQKRYAGDSLQQFLSPGGPGEPDPDEAGRKWICPHDDCFKAYRQPSGLRYHMKHGHPKDTHFQFESVPPALERELPKKAKKMRFRKDGSAFDSACPSVAPSPRSGVGTGCATLAAPSPVSGDISV